MYPIPIQIQDSWSALPKNLVTQKTFIVTDKNIADLYLPNIQTFFQNPPYFILPPGETAKNLENTVNLIRAFQDAGLDRRSCIIALGGGVVSDITGFAASIYMRGIPYIILPTTLLAMVDSSIGGKTGIDFAGTKNLVGAFHNPSLVYINTGVLDSLDNTEYISGLAEVIKYGIILDSNLFGYIDANRKEIAIKNPAAINKIIRDCTHLKSQVVAADEREANLRQILNYGHTFGHAIESLGNFTLPHGHCVALGMVCAAHFSYNMGGMSMFHVEHICELLQYFGLPTRLPANLHLTADDIYNMMLKDKKTKGGALTLIISHKIGTVEIINKASKNQVMKAIGEIE